MNFTRHQAAGFVHAAFESMSLRAWLCGACGNGTPHAGAIVASLRDQPWKGQMPHHAQRMDLAAVLDAIARVLRNPEEPIRDEELEYCEACDCPVHVDDLKAAGWFVDEEQCAVCPRCLKAIEEQNQQRHDEEAHEP